MYIETSYPRVPGDVARLVSPTYTASNEYSCLQFYYHQYGTDIGAFNVYKRDVGGSLIPVKLFSSLGNRLDEWHVMEISILSSKPYNIIFEGVVGKSYEGVSLIEFVKIFDLFEMFTFRIFPLMMFLLEIELVQDLDIVILNKASVLIKILKKIVKWIGYVCVVMSKIIPLVAYTEHI